MPSLLRGTCKLNWATSKKFADHAV